MRFTSSLLPLLLSLVATFSPTTAQTTVVVGDLPAPVGWTDGVCYAPVQGMRAGDSLEFNFQGHNVYKMATLEDYEACDFESAVLLAQIGTTTTHTYTVTDQDARAGTLYFSCRIGAHCGSGNQKLMVELDQSLDSPLDDMSNITRQSNPNAIRDIPVSRYIAGRSNCDGLTADDFLPPPAGVDGNDLGIMQSVCTDPIVEPDTGRYYSSCLSAPVPMTPGGVVNQLQFLHYPYPKDRRVKVGLRTWEFVADIPDGSGDVIAVPINQLYVHHLSGRVVLGQGTEGIRQSAPDAPFPEPYALITGDEGDSMIFHIIDLRGVGDDWLSCIECRCKDNNGTYLDIGGSNDFGVTTTGGVDCCTNCTSLTTPTIDYRMRYNVSFSDIEDEVVKELRMITADISPAVGANLEFDVPQFNNLPANQVKPDDPTVQRLTREGPFNELFQIEFFAGPYNGPDTVRIFRCVGHLHVAAIGMWLEDAETGENICANVGNYGTDPNADKGFLNGLSVESFDEPIVIPADHPVRLVSDYDATEFHTGVMGMWFLFIDAERNVTRAEADLTIELCEDPICDSSVLPALKPIAAVCEDELASSPLCRFAGICECDALINDPASTGCGGEYSSPQGNVPINSLCQKSCDCPDAGAVLADGGCADTLAVHPACTFGGMCSCEALANASGGCGTVLENAAGDIVINDVCASFCDACPEVGSASDVMEESMVEQLEEVLAATCLLATPECRKMLQALYSCGTQMQMESTSTTRDSQPSSTGEAIVTDMEMDTTMQMVVRKHGSQMAMEYAKLGHPSLHFGQAEQVVRRCVDDAPDVDPSDSTDMNQTEAGDPMDDDSAGVVSSLSASLAAAAFAWMVVAF